MKYLMKFNEELNTEDIESKKKEFDLAKFGIIGLESAFGVLNTSLSKYVDLEKIINTISIAPRTIMGLEAPTIEVGNAANITMFNPKEEWIFTESDISSKSKNTPFIGSSLEGRAIATYSGGKLSIC